jgi:hypothetical protein
MPLAASFSGATRSAGGEWCDSGVSRLTLARLQCGGEIGRGGITRDSFHLRECSKVYRQERPDHLSQGKQGGGEGVSLDVFPLAIYTPFGPLTADATWRYRLFPSHVIGTALLHPAGRAAGQLAKICRRARTSGMLNADRACRHHRSQRHFHYSRGQELNLADRPRRHEIPRVRSPRSMSWSGRHQLRRNFRLRQSQARCE